MDIYTIYKATNKINGKIYIGFDSRWPTRRSCHKSASFNPNHPDRNNYFHNAINKYGWEAFEWEPIYQSLDRDYTLETMEDYFITEYDTFKSPNGYNAVRGGSGNFGLVHSAESRKKISDNHYDCSGANNPRAKLIIIEGPDNFKVVCNGNFKLKCLELGLAYSTATIFILKGRKVTSGSWLNYNAYYA